MPCKLLLETMLLVSGLLMAGSMPSVACVADPASDTSPGPSPHLVPGSAAAQTFSSSLNVCLKWKVVRDPAHPEWPGHFVHTPAVCMEANALRSQGLVSRDLTLRAGDKTVLRFGSHNAVTLIAAVALQDGSAGEVIRLRSTLGSTVLWGRIQPDGSTELTLHAVSQQAVPGGPQLKADRGDRF